MIPSRRVVTAFLLGVFLPLSVATLVHTPVAEAQNAAEIEELQGKIDARNQRLKEIEAEIAKYEASLQEVGGERASLEQAIRQLELEHNKISAEIDRTQNKIDTADLTLNKLSTEIGTAEKRITTLREGLAQSIRSDYQDQQQSMVLILLDNDTLADFWNDLEVKEVIRSNITKQVSTLHELRSQLLNKEAQAESERQSLVSLREQYSNQTSVLAINRAEKNELLQATKSEEATYQELLTEKKRVRQQLESEMREFESRLQFILDPTTIPSAGTQVFNWPIDTVRITQYFGGSEFAKRNPGVYGGRAYHPGVDFGVPRGTPIKAPLTGTVRATGDTDLVSGCYSWGRWSLIDHANGLTTLYAHQDLVTVSPGQKVKTGEIIGYSGNTGYSTGPHLHFTVYAKDAVSVRQFNQIRTTTSCGSAKTPVAATEGYLDPIQYLPAY